MKLFSASSMVFAALFTTAMNAHAIFIPGVTKTPVYFCEGETMNIRVYHEAEGSSLLALEQITENRANNEVLEEAVDEMTNKSQTIYASDDVVLKITHHPSGILPATLFIGKDSNAEKIAMKCQVVYRIMNSPQSM